MKLNYKKIRLYTVNAINDYNDNNLLPMYKLINNKSKNVFLTILLLGISLTCFLICFYQIYDRINYYLSKPIAVLIDLEYQDFIAPPNIKVGNVDTEALRPFWTDKSELILTCHLVLKGFLKQKNLNVSILDDLWNAVNVQANLDYINITYGEKILSHTKYENGKITTETIADSIKLFNKSNVYGNELVISFKKKFPVGHKLIIEISNKGECNDYDIGSIMVAIDDREAYRYFTLLLVNTKLLMSYSIRQYNYINSLKNPCEKKQQNVDKCSKDCFSKIYKKYYCRLPFMSKMKSVTNCSQIHNLTLISKVYLKAAYTAHITLVTSQCKCKRPCVQPNFFLQGENIETKKEGKFKLILFQRDLFKTIFVEKYAYKKLQLLIDIAGNLGLFLGISILSLFNLTQCFCGQVLKLRLASDKIKVDTQLALKINKQLLKLNAEKRKLQQQQQSSFSANNLFYRFVLILLLFCSSVLIYNSFELYFSYPTRIVVVISEPDAINIPNLIFCSEGNRITLLKNKLQKKTNISICNWHFLDLIDEKNILPDKLWSLQTITFDKKIVELFVKAVSGESEIAGLQYNYSKIILHSGICFEFTFVPIKFGGTATAATLYFEGNKLQCNGKIDIYIKQSIDTPLSIIKSLEHIPISNVVLYINTMQLQKSNSPVKKCISQDNFKKCRDKCYVNQLKLSANCRLPFMKELKQNITVCNSTSSAKNQYYDYLKLSQKKCNCHPPCNETVYTLSFGSDVDKLFSLVFLMPRSNFIENIIEELPYGIVALLCDIANNFGLTIGISLLLITQTFLKYISKILNCVISKVLKIMPN